MCTNALVNGKADAQVICVDPALREHPNLTLLTNTYVEKLGTDPAGRAVTSVRAVRRGEPVSFSADIAERFFAALRDRFDGDVALEPRHASWFEPEAEQLVTKHRVARVAADPAVVSEAAEPGGWDGLVYYRLHGSPKVYHSAYAAEYLEALAKSLSFAARSAAVWCIFDNTAAGAATANALNVLDRA